MTLSARLKSNTVSSTAAQLRHSFGLEALVTRSSSFCESHSVSLSRLHGWTDEGKVGQVGSAHLSVLGLCVRVTAFFQNVCNYSIADDPSRLPDVGLHVHKTIVT